MINGKYWINEKDKDNMKRDWITKIQDFNGRI